MELNYIGLKNVTTSSSGYFVNDLPGMATELADSVTFSDEQTTEELWTSIQKRAYLRLNNYATLLLSDRAKLNQVVLSTMNIKTHSKRLEPIAANASELRGVYLRCPESKYASLKINSLFVYNSGSDIAEDEYIFIYNANDGSLLNTIESGFTTGLNEIPINLEFAPGFGITQIFICISGICDTIRIEDDYYNWIDPDRSCISCLNDRYMDVYPANILDSVLPQENYLTRGVGKGVWVSADVICTPDSFITRHKNNFTTALLYLIGSELLKSKKGSPRLNIFTASNLIYTEELHKEFEDEWTKAAKQAVNGISLTGESVCFNCEESQIVATIGMLP